MSFLSPGWVLHDKTRFVIQNNIFQLNLDSLRTRLMGNFAREVLHILDFLSNKGSSLDLDPDTSSESRDTTFSSGGIPFFHPHHSCPIFIFIDTQSNPDEPGLSCCLLRLRSAWRQEMIPNPCTTVFLLHFSRGRTIDEKMLALPSAFPRRSLCPGLTVATDALLHFNSYSCSYLPETLSVPTYLFIH